MGPTSARGSRPDENGRETPRSLGRIEPLGVLASSDTGVALVALIALNLLNYIDRSLLAGAQPLIQKALHASDASMGALSSRFFIAFMIAAPLLGWLGDRFPRRVLIPITVAGWSLGLGAATIGPDFNWFPYGYMIAAAGEAAFGVYAVSMVSDYYPGANRTRALSFYILSMNGGRALGYPVGGWLAERFGWQAPFRLMAVVGLLLGLLAFKFLIEPQKPEQVRSESTPSGGPAATPLRALLGRGYVCVVLGLAMENFAMGGLHVWLPTYLHRYLGYTVAHAAGVLGTITLTCGIGGTWLGGVMGERLLRRDRRALYWISAACFFLAIPSVLAILTPLHALILLGVVGVQLVLFLNLGPLNTAMLNAVPASVRSTAVAVALFTIHALGDAISPRLIGMLSDAHGLRGGMSVTLIALAIGGVLLMTGARGAPELPGAAEEA